MDFRSNAGMQISAGPEMQCTFVNVFQISRHFITNLIMTDCYSGKLLTFSYQKRSERRGASVIQIDLTNYNWEYLVCVRKEVAVYGMRKTNFKLFVELNNQTFQTHVCTYLFTVTLFLKEPSGYQIIPSRGFFMSCSSANPYISPHFKGTTLPEV